MIYIFFYIQYYYQCYCINNYFNNILFYFFLVGLIVSFSCKNNIYKLYMDLEKATREKMIKFLHQKGEKGLSKLRREELVNLAKKIIKKEVAPFFVLLPVLTTSMTLGHKLLK